MQSEDMTEGDYSSAAYGKMRQLLRDNVSFCHYALLATSWPLSHLGLVVHDGDLRAVAQLELAEDRADVVAHRALGQEEARRDIAIVHALGNELVP